MEVSAAANIPIEAVEIGEAAIRGMRTRAADYIDLRDAVGAVLSALTAAGWTLTPPDTGEGFREATMHREALLDAEEAKGP
jgi:hypothetical protein